MFANCQKTRNRLCEHFDRIFPGGANSSNIELLWNTFELDMEVKASEEIQDLKATTAMMEASADIVILNGNKLDVDY